jgi:predicted secreted protein
VSWATIAAIYFIVWWMVLFAVLPWGVRSQSESADDMAPGTDPGAPSLPALGKKLIWTTLVSAALFAVLYYVYTSRVITLDDLAALLGMRR